MPALRWRVHEELVDLVDSEETSLRPTAREIGAAVFSGLRIVKGAEFDSSPATDLPHLTFSRALLPCKLWVQARDHGLFLSLIAADETDQRARINRGQDQIVIAKRWHPIASGQCEETYSWLDSRGIPANSEISVADLLTLRLTRVLPCELIDDLSSTATDASSREQEGPLRVSGLDATLYPYQADGVRFLMRLSAQDVGCVLADEMGLGKTLQVIALLQTEKNAGRAASLVIAPATLLENWRREIAMFAGSLNVLVHAGPSRAGIAQALEGYDVVLVAYDTAVRDQTILAAKAWNVIVLDEAQNIKNPDALRTRAVKQLPRRVSVAVTGTPLENRLSDLWSITDFALPGSLGSLSEFNKSFSDAVDDAARVGHLIAPILLRRAVQDVAGQLPPKIEIPQPIGMSPALAREYEEVRLAALASYGDAGTLVATSKLRMLCCHPLLVDIGRANPADEMPKYARLLELLEEIFAVNEKVLIFTSFQKMMDIFMSDLASKFPNAFFSYIDGRIPSEARQDTVDQFSAHPNYGALFLNPKAAGAGLNIVCANHVIHYNPNWNPAVTAQATARSYRTKQSRPVTVHHMYFSDTVEDAMTQTAAFKQILAEEAVIGNDGSADALSIAHALSLSPLRSASYG